MQKSVKGSVMYCIHATVLHSTTYGITGAHVLFRVCMYNEELHHGRVDFVTCILFSLFIQHAFLKLLGYLWIMKFKVYF